MLKLLRRKAEQAPVDVDFMTWATGEVGEEGARAAAHYIAVATFHHDPGSLSARFVHERLRRATKLPPEAHYPRGGWGSVIDRMAALAWNLGVRVETLSRVDDPGALTAEGPVVVATALPAARHLLRDGSLQWNSARTTLVDLALRSRKGDPFAISDLDGTGWVERFTTQDRSLAPAGQELVQAQIPLSPRSPRRQDRPASTTSWTWVSRTGATASSGAATPWPCGRTGAVDLPGTTWRDRPAIDRGDGVYLAGDQVAAPGLLSEVSFNSALEAVTLALAPARLDLKSA